MNILQYCSPFLVLLTPLLLITAPLPASAESKAAIVVGIAAYDENLGANPLRYADRDAGLVASALEKQGYKVLPLVNGQATNDNILSAIRQVGGQLPPDGALIFAFSGHGFADEQTKENYLVTSDTQISYGSGVTRIQNGLKVSNLAESIRKAGIKQSVLFLDACRNAPVAGAKDIGVQSFVNEDTGEGISILYSTRIGERSWESRKLKHGIFSYFLSEGISGKAETGNDDSLSFDELAGFVEQEVKRWSKENEHAEQTPFRAGERTGIFVIGGKIRFPEQSANYEQEAFIEDFYGSKYDLEQKWNMLPAATQKVIGSKDNFWAFWTKTIDRSKAPDVRAHLQPDGSIKAQVKFHRLDGGTHCSSDTLRLQQEGTNWKVLEMQLAPCSE
jgi:hypothetical protein